MDDHAGDVGASEFDLAGAEAGLDVEAEGNGGALAESERGWMRRPRPCTAVPNSAFAGVRFPPEVITLAERWYLRFGLSYAASRSSWPSGAWRSTT
jgi:hypothetical protein